jgi:hypothetical protein
MARWAAFALAALWLGVGASDAGAQERRGRRRAPVAAPAAEPSPEPSATVGAAAPATAAPEAPAAGPVLGPALPPTASTETGGAAQPTAAPGSTVAAPVVGSGEPSPAPDAREAEEATYERLFGAADEPGTPAERSPVVAPSLPFQSPVWVWAVIVGLGLAWVAGKVWERRRVAVAPASLRVISTTSLGQGGGISVVEVKDADGALRRLLVGHGGGAPRLIVELDGLRDFGAAESTVAPFAAPLAAVARAAEPARASEPADRGQGPASVAGDPPSRSGEAARTGGGARTAAPRAPAAGPRPLAPRSDLIAEVLAERGEDEQDALDEASDRPSGAYTFRGLLG